MLKIIGVIMLAVLIVAVIGVSVSTVYHRYQLGQEVKEYPPPGRMVEVNGNELHIYTEGNADKTLVFMAGHGTSNPMIDFKPLWKPLADEYKIVVVEKNGYGWSKTSRSPRDLDTILEETREVLEKAGVMGPYILVPHSMSGLEALQWTQKYPEEVQALICLDPVTPNVIELLPSSPKFQLYSLHLISQIGLSRFMPESDQEKNFPILTSGLLTEEEKQEYLAIFYRSAFTMPMLREVQALKENAEMVAEKEIPKDIPLLLLISKEQDRNVKGWKDAVTEYLASMDHTGYIELNTGHYLHHEQSEIVVEEIREFLQELQ